jgi:anti-anti-sigma factor
MIQKNDVGAFHVFSFNNRKRIDMLIVDEMEETILGTFNNRSKDIVLDLQGIDFIDSTAFTTLLEINKAVKEKGKNLLLSNTSEDIIELIQLVKMEHTLKFFPTDKLSYR